MIGTVEDLRILRLARLYEEAYERFVLAVAAEVADDEVRRRLAPLEPPEDQHAERLRRHAERLTKLLSSEESPQIAASALADVVEIERAAREFYFQNADRIHDAELRKLFHDLAHEEARHIEIAQSTLDDYLERKKIPKTRVPPPNNEMPLLWEGTGDLGPIPPR